MDATDSPLFTRRDGSAWFVNVLGGLKRGGAWRMPRDMWFVSLIGGANLDLTTAELPGSPVLSKVSVVGGVSLVLPQDVAVEVEGFRLFGGVRVQAGAVPATRTLRIREYSVAGGVHVRRG